MILKSFSHHSTATYGNLVSYILNPKKSIDGKVDIITHNIRSKEGDTQGYAKEFKLNQALGKQRKNGVTIHHIVISLSSNENPKFATKAVLQDLAMKYMELRGHDKLYLAGIHTDRVHIHAHIAQSSQTFGTACSTRISKAEFQGIKIELENYQKTKYQNLPNLLWRMEVVRNIYETELGRKHIVKNAKTKNKN